MVIDDIKNLGYKVDNNYVISDNYSLLYKIRIIIPYGFNREELLIFPYSSLFLGILNNYFTFPCKIDYKMGPTYSILKINLYDLHNIPIVLGTIFNFMESIEVDKLLTPLDTNGSGESLMDKFLKSNIKLYNEGNYDFLSYKGTPVSDLMYKEYQFLSTASYEEKLKKLNNTKEVFKEEKSIIFIQGMNASKLNFKSHKLDVDRIEKCELYENNKYSIIDNAKTVTLTFNKDADDRINYILNLFLLDFYSELFETHKLITSIPDSIVFYFDTDIEKYGEDVLTAQWGNRLFNEKDENFYGLYCDFKCRFIEKVLSHYDNYDNDIDKAVDVFTGNEIFYTRGEIIEVINQITMRPLSEFIKDIHFIIDLVEKSRKEAENV